MRRRRSRWLWALVLWFAVLGVSAAWRGLALWGERALLYELGSSLAPPVLTLYVVSFVACGAAMTVAAVGLWFWRNWARHAARVGAAAYVLAAQTYSWLFVRSGLSWTRRWVTLVWALAVLALSVGVLTWPRSRARLGLA